VTEQPPLVLVAEDEPLASMALRAQLEALGFRVVGPARDGDEAVALGRCFPVDLAIFDFRMPRRTGLQAAQDLFDMAPTPVVLLSGFNAGHLPEHIPRPPIFASITKPADMAELRRALDAAHEGFQQWLTAEPRRNQLMLDLNRERGAIADWVTSMAGGAPPATIAVRLVERAAREERPLVDMARQMAALRS
jgi:two-component system, response regulator PdtaR